MNIDEVDHLIWLQTAFLGDMILTSAAITLAKKHFPQKKNILISSAMGCAALKNCPSLDFSISVEKRGINFFKDIHNLPKQLAQLGVNPKRAILLRVHRSPRSALIALKLGIFCIGYRQTAFCCIQDISIERIAVWHEAQRIACLLEPLGVSREAIQDARPSLQKLPAIKDWHFEISHYSKPMVGLACGSVWQTKRWPIEYFVAVAISLAQRGLGVVLLGSEQDRGLADQIELAMSEKNLNKDLFNLVGKSDLNDLCFVVPQLCLLISNDSAPLHFASAFSIPTLALFGPTTEAMGFGPLAPHSMSLGVDLPCRPCGLHGQNACPLGHFQCMKNLQVEQVLKAAEIIFEPVLSKK